MSEQERTRAKPPIDWLDPGIDPKTVGEAFVTTATPEYDQPAVVPELEH
ncbi:hypothetical protein [Amycolatopsis sp. cmx-4-68]